MFLSVLEITYIYVSLQTSFLVSTSFLFGRTQGGGGCLTSPIPSSTLHPYLPPKVLILLCASTISLIFFIPKSPPGTPSSLQPEKSTVSSVLNATVPRPITLSRDLGSIGLPCKFRLRSLSSPTYDVGKGSVVVR